MSERTKMTREERAKQFMPFAALRGFSRLIEEQGKERCEKRPLSEEQEEELSRTLSRLKKGDMVRAVFYDGEAYVSVEGKLSSIDPVGQTLTVVRQIVSFCDLDRISVEN